MLTEECELNPYLEARGIEVADTDLGERIVQFARTAQPHRDAGHPYKAVEVKSSELFHEHIGTEKGATELRTTSRLLPGRTLRRKSSSQIGPRASPVSISRSRKPADSVVCTNEGNADLLAHFATESAHRLHGDRETPSRERRTWSLPAAAPARSATGKPITHIFDALSRAWRMTIANCTSCWSTTDAPSDLLHSEEFQRSLRCIRCGACMNTCPVYRRSGGHSYGATYSGPIGVIIDPTFNLRKYSALPFASTLNGSCTSVCPVKINIHEQIYKWREIIDERNQLPIVKTGSDADGGQGAGEPGAVPDGREGRQFGPRLSAAHDDLQPAQRVGATTRSTENAQADFS